MKTKIESLLFISHKPLTVRAIVSALGKAGEKVTPKDAQEMIDELKQKYNSEDSGINIVQAGQEVQMVTSPSNTAMIKTFL